MRRDWDVIREILTALEERDPTSGGLRLQDFPAERAHTYSYHTELLLNRSLVSGNLSQVIGNPSRATDFHLQHLTWEGHDLLDTMRSNAVWERIKTLSTEKGIELSFDAVKTLGKVALEWVLRQ
jgi:hypothetical protein